MATFIPSIEKIMQFNVKPEEGELHLLNFLSKTLDDSFEIYFNPYMNGDRPDVVIMRKNYGVMIIEVKDWDLNLYEVDEKKHWKLKTDNNAYPLSPIQQVLKYKDNLYELHIENLLEKKILDIRNFNIVVCAVYFHNANEQQIKDLLVSPFAHDIKYQSFLKYNIDLIGRDNLNELDFKKILQNRYLIANRESFLFTGELYNSFKSFLNPPIHMREQGEQLVYSEKQKEIIYGDKKQQRIKGVVGSGKTTVLAARAVQAYKRISKEKPNAQVLILTYNITLKNYIHDKISRVREEFPWSAFVISNYHLFINSQLNNLGIQFEKEKLTDLEQNYYSNKKLFLEHKSLIKPFDAIFIDEIQDYKRPWMEIIKECFLVEGGEYVLFGDVKQNIYSNITDNKDVSTNVKGVTELKRCFRSDYKIKDLAVEFQKNIFRDKYEIDTFNKNDGQIEMQFERNQQGHINYMFLSNTNVVSALYTIIHENILNKNNNQISRNDVTILGLTVYQLRRFEAYYRYASGERTKTMFETFEIMYLNRLNMYGNASIPTWLNDGLKLIKREKDYKKDTGFGQLAQLFTIYDLYKEYPEKFQVKIDSYCSKYNTSRADFEEYLKANETEFNKYKNEVYNADYEFIRKNKKIHFWMNSGTIKISTIHSFKGWESELLFLIIEPQPDINMAFDELLYTGLTRCRSNLVIINFGNENYNNKIKSLVDSVNSMH